MKKSPALATVFIAVLVDLIGFGIVLPLLPFYASVFGATPFQIGLLYSVFSGAQLVFSPVWGSLSDRVGRRPIMMISTLGACAAYALFAVAGSLWLLMTSRLLAGIMGGNISAAQAYIADVTSEEDRAAGMGFIGAAFGIGFLIGPALGAFLIHPGLVRILNIPATHPYVVPGLFAAMMSLASFLLVCFRLPESVRPDHAGGVKNERLTVFTGRFWRTVRGNGSGNASPVLPVLVTAVFFIILAQASLYSAFPLFCRHQMALEAMAVGYLFTYMGAIAIIVQGILMRRLCRRFGERRLILTGSILMALGLVWIPFSGSAALLTAALGLMSVGGSLNVPTLNSLISKSAASGRTGATMGLSQGIASLARVVGPVAGGALYGLWYGLPFIATAALLAPAVFAGPKKQS